MNFSSTVYGKYFLLDRIAIGGMAEVFKAKTFGVRGFERLLVIKRILPHLSKDEEFVEMFIDEAKISVELSHANICQVTDLGKITDNYFIAMEYIDGKDLRAILKKCYKEKKTLSISQALFIAIEILKGLDYAHRKTEPFSGKPLNIIHRDISPQNIMISYEADVKIVDFGIAKTEAKLGRTQAGVLKGKFGYMSPEQASGLELDQRTDVFSAGIILYEMLTKRRLFLGENDFDTLERIKECSIPPPSKYNSQISPELEKLIFKTLAKERDDRFSSAQEMQLALSKIFYTSTQDFSPANLSTFLHELFAQEIADEHETLRRAMDSLPQTDFEAAASAAQASHARLHDPSVDTKKSGSLKPSYEPTPRKSWGPDLSYPPWLKEQIRRTRPWFPLLGRLGILLGTLLITLFIGWKWMTPKDPGSTPPQSADPEVTAINLKVQLLTDPAGAIVRINNQEWGQTPTAIPLLPQKTYSVSFTKEGYEPLLKKILVTKDQTTYGPFRLTKYIPPTGIIRVTSTPAGADIFIERRNSGLKTPATLEGLTLNQSHLIKLALSGHQSKSEEVYLSEARQDISFTLEPKLVTLRLNILPRQAKVILDDRERGHTIEKLEAGKAYSLKVEARGYKSKRQTITLKEATEEINIELERIAPVYGNITLGADPWARIFVDGKEAGHSPLLDYKVTVGKHTFEFRHPDFKPVKKTLRIRKGENPKLIVDLKTGN